MLLSSFVVLCLLLFHSSSDMLFGSGGSKIFQRRLRCDRDGIFSVPKKGGGVGLHLQYFASECGIPKNGEKLRFDCVNIFNSRNPSRSATVCCCVHMYLEVVFIIVYVII